MARLVKGYSYGYSGFGYTVAPSYDFGEPVKIDNEVYFPGEDEETGEVISPEEMKRRAEVEKAAEEKRFNEAVEERAAQTVARILEEKNAAIEKERAEIIEKSKAEAAATVAEAKANTMAVMEKAQRDCLMLREQTKKEGYDEGYSAGHEKGYSEGRTQSLDKYKKYIDASGKLLEEINSRKEAYYISCEEEMRETVFELVNKIVRTELRVNPKVIETLMAAAAKNFRNADFITVTLAEDGISERFRTDAELVKEIVPFIPEIEFEIDEEAEEGTLVLDDGSQIVDASVPTQLEFLKEIMRTTRGEDEPAVFDADITVGGTSAPAASLTDTAAADDGAETDGAADDGAADDGAKTDGAEVAGSVAADAVPAEEPAAAVPASAEAAESADIPEETAEADGGEEQPEMSSFADVLAEAMAAAGNTEAAADGGSVPESAAETAEEVPQEAVQIELTETAAEEKPEPRKKSRPRTTAAETAE